MIFVYLRYDIVERSWIFAAQKGKSVLAQTNCLKVLKSLSRDAITLACEDVQCRWVATEKDWLSLSCLKDFVFQKLVDFFSEARIRISGLRGRSLKKECKRPLRTKS